MRTHSDASLTAHNGGKTRRLFTGGTQQIFTLFAEGITQQNFRSGMYDGTFRTNRGCHTRVTKSECSSLTLIRENEDNYSTVFRIDFVFTIKNRLCISSTVIALVVCFVLGGGFPYDASKQVPVL
jgi:hypothetical protein